MRGSTDRIRKESLMTYIPISKVNSTCNQQDFHRSEDRWIRATIDLAGKIGVKCLISQDVFFHNRSQKPMSDLLHAIRTNRTLDTCKEHLFPNGERCFHDTENFERFFCDLPVFEEGTRLSYELNEQCSFSFSQLRYSTPKMISMATRPKIFRDQFGRARKGRK
jgi:DNA polymerase III alpha subunit